MRKYSRKTHLRRLRIMAELGKFDGCPAAPGFDPGRRPAEIFRPDGLSIPCHVCTSSVGLPQYSQLCPCIALGPTEAWKRTKDVLGGR